MHTQISTYPFLAIHILLFSHSNISSPPSLNGSLIFSPTHASSAPSKLFFHTSKINLFLNRCSPLAMVAIMRQTQPLDGFYEPQPLSSPLDSALYMATTHPCTVQKRLVSFPSYSSSTTFCPPALQHPPPSLFPFTLTTPRYARLYRINSSMSSCPHLMQLLQIEI